MTTETLPTTVPLEPTTPIKPSEAIRLGCLVSPIQMFDDLYVSDDGRESCVYGAMALGQGARGYDDVIDLAEELVVARDEDCPECGRGDEDTLVHLNDYHRWSRERIADWLEGLGL